MDKHLSENQSLFDGFFGTEERALFEIFGTEGR